MSGLPILVGGVLPRVFARESILARERLAQRFLDYFQQGHHVEGGSGAVHARLRHNEATGMPLADTARGEVGACMAFLNNTVPGAFWVLYHMYADPAVLRDVRRELLAHAAVRADDDSSHHTLHVESVCSACPVLKSTVHEVFRFRGIGTGMVRRVLEDQRLGSGYLLKKGGLIFAPNSVQHLGATGVRGADGDRFDHRRFLQPGCGGLKGTSVLRIFGGGGSYCPGRHFASTQLLVFTSLIVLMADIRPLAGRDWADVTADKSFGLGIATGFLMPDRDIEVEIVGTRNSVKIK